MMCASVALCVWSCEENSQSEKENEAAEARHSQLNCQPQKNERAPWASHWSHWTAQWEWQ